MIEFLRNWIVSVVVMVIFVVFMDMIMPEGSIKKYARFVTGLIVIITILTPVFKLFDRNADIETMITQYTSAYDTEVSNINQQKVKHSIQSQSIEVFKEKLKEKIQQDIYDYTGKKYGVVNIEISADEDNIYGFTEVKSIELKSLSDNKAIKSVDQVVIGNNVRKESEQRDEKVVDILKTKYDISPSSIKFVK